jgi:hypothetical protein
MIVSGLIMFIMGDLLIMASSFSFHSHFDTYTWVVQLSIGITLFKMGLLICLTQEIKESIEKVKS